MVRQLADRFQDLYGESGEEVCVSFAPGRVNLIGEHIDYNGGDVLPCALDLGTYAVVRRRSDRTVCFYSENRRDTGIVTCSLDDLAYRTEDDWANYPKGIVQALDHIAPLDSGFDMLVRGTLPLAAGLSSSASLELAAAVGVSALRGSGPDTGEQSLADVARMAQRVENDYIGLKSGIMDQFTAAVARPGHALLLNCQTLEHRHIPLNLGDYTLVIADTHHPRGLADSAYNQRRATCERALRKVRRMLPVANLASLTPDQFEAVSGTLDEKERRRVRHVVSEQVRTVAAAQSLENGDLDTFGRLLNESHQSLRDDCEVTGRDLDLLVSLAQAQPETLGARMTGAGFGGCTVNLVRADTVDEFTRRVGTAYASEVGHSPSFYPVRASGGARILHPDEEVDWA